MATSLPLENLRNIVVIGAGVVGLTTALKIQEKGGHQVTIIAETFPSDPKNIRYTSPWAGAHHVSSAGEDARLKKLDMDTFKVMWDLSAPGGGAEDCFLRLDQTEYYREAYTKPDPLEMMPDSKYVSKDDLIPGAAYGISFRTLTIDTPKYLNYLLARFLASGGSIVQGILQHISQIIEGGATAFSGGGKPSRVDGLVVCAGLGARMLGGIEDKGVYPIRGQTVLLNAPWIRYGRTMVEKDGLRTYTIPRRNGDVIVGGTIDKDDWYPTPRPEITTDILQRVFILCPELAPPEIRAMREPTVEDLLPLILEEGCGLRPARAGGVRIELEWFEDLKGKRNVPIVHNYGHGGFGYQSSWGSASMALELLEGAFEGKE